MMNNIIAPQRYMCHQRLPKTRQDQRDGGHFNFQSSCFQGIPYERRIVWLFDTELVSYYPDAS
ncbi:hypothetical protein TGAM01_v206565 [Trichoderma gamsii]|uniref:Uncharacterized protein n=1 Tax=Trichoderma gamsii TaxID=398673 RepID=A0A2P4ZK49_9HYPO|nr:hypothetical protein TGAM01_v206565 [Trichoderma gamsii]PON24635.1 hypothetical protein TGAM01_v206565 [Trichoderma gamsii]